MTICLVKGALGYRSATGGDLHLDPGSRSINRVLQFLSRTHGEGDVRASHSKFTQLIPSLYRGGMDSCPLLPFNLL